MKIVSPVFTETYDPRQIRELVRRLEDALEFMTIDQRRGAITVTGDYTLTKDDSLVMVAPVAAATVTITVPDVAQWMIDAKWGWNIKLIAAGTLIVQPVSDTIEGTTDVTTAVVNTALEIRATDDGWKVV